MPKLKKKCFISSCISNRIQSDLLDNLKYFSFPQRGKRLTDWCSSLQISLQEISIAKRPKLCSLHFKETDFQTTFFGNYLRMTCVPLVQHPAMIETVKMYEDLYNEQNKPEEQYFTVTEIKLEEPLNNEPIEEFFINNEIEFKEPLNESVEEFDPLMLVKEEVDIIDYIDENHKDKGNNFKEKSFKSF